MDIYEILLYLSKFFLTFYLFIFQVLCIYFLFSVGKRDWHVVAEASLAYLFLKLFKDLVVSHDDSCLCVIHSSNVTHQEFILYIYAMISAAFGNFLRW